MKAILMSINPKWVAKILNGEKTIEIRKRFPKDYVGWVYIYCNKARPYLVRSNGLVDNLAKEYDKNYTPKPKKFELYNFEDEGYSAEFYNFFNGKVVARFWCDKVENAYNFYTEELCQLACISKEELCKYAGGWYKTDDLLAIHITNLEIFDKPKEISEFRHSHCDNLKNIKVVHNYFDDDYVFQYFDNERCRKCNHYDSDCNDCLKDFKPLTRAPQSYCFIEI